MKTAWTSGLSKDEKQEMADLFKGSVRVRRRLGEILQDKIDEYHRAMFLRNSYKDPNWEMVQADTIGYMRGLYEVVSLLEDSEGELPIKRPVGRPRKDSKQPNPLT